MLKFLLVENMFMHAVLTMSLFSYESNIVSSIGSSFFTYKLWFIDNSFARHFFRRSTSLLRGQSLYISVRWNMSRSLPSTFEISLLVPRVPPISDSFLMQRIRSSKAWGLNKIYAAFRKLSSAVRYSLCIFVFLFMFLLCSWSRTSVSSQSSELYFGYLSIANYGWPVEATECLVRSKQPLVNTFALQRSIYLFVAIQTIETISR